LMPMKTDVRHRRRGNPIAGGASMHNEVPEKRGLR
jgi:hypothetical protein